jgi:glutamyl-tRNA reductase
MNINKNTKKKWNFIRCYGSSNPDTKSTFSVIFCLCCALFLLSNKKPKMPATDTFYCVGVSYKKADASLRGKFSLTTSVIPYLFDDAQTQGISSLVVSSTCNRTEIYAQVDDVETLKTLLFKHSEGTKEAFEKVGVVRKGQDAIMHLFRVGTGLDSQILGDFEIIAQLKQSFKLSKRKNMLSSYMERMFNAVIQASKCIKTETELSSGATSVSYVSVRYMLDTIPDLDDKNILLFGVGKIGRNTCENLIKHTKNNHITLINRTRERAEELGGKFSIDVKDYAALPVEIRKADVLVVATGAEKPTIAKSVIHTDKPLLILDLSMPKNVNPNVEELPNVTLLHLDELSKMSDKTLLARQKFVPQAEIIIREVLADFNAWMESRKFAPAISAVKKLMQNIQQKELEVQRKKNPSLDEVQAVAVSERLIQKLTNRMANQLRESADTDESVKALETLFNVATDE